MAVSWAPILKWIMIVNWALSSLCPDASQSSTAPQPANTSDQDKKETLSKNVYENVTVNPNDPFLDFEESLRRASKVRIKKVGVYITP